MGTNIFLGPEEDRSVRQISLHMYVYLVHTGNQTGESGGLTRLETPTLKGGGISLAEGFSFFNLWVFPLFFCSFLLSCSVFVFCMLMFKLNLNFLKKELLTFISQIPQPAWPVIRNCAGTITQNVHKLKFISNPSSLV